MPEISFKKWWPTVVVVVIILMLLAAYSGWLTTRVAPGLPFRIVTAGEGSPEDGFVMVRGIASKVEWDTRPDNARLYPSEMISLCPVSQVVPSDKCYILRFQAPNNAAATVTIPETVAPGKWNLVLTARDARQMLRLDVNSAVTVSVADNSIAAEEGDLGLYLPLDKNVDDSTGNHLNGSVLGKLGSVDGKVENAYHFDGKSYITVPASKILSVASNQNITLQAWIKTSTVRPLAGIIKRGVRSANADASQEYALVLREGHPQIIVGNGSQSVKVTSDQVIKDGQWHLLTAVIGDDKIKLYIDENETAQAARSFKNGLSKGTISQVIGALNNGYFVGDIDEVRIWLDELDEDDIIPKAAVFSPSPSPSSSPAISSVPPTSSPSPSIEVSPSPEASLSSIPSPSPSQLLAPVLNLANSGMILVDNLSRKLFLVLNFDWIYYPDVECMAVEINNTDGCREFQPLPIDGPISPCEPEQLPQPICNP